MAEPRATRPTHTVLVDGGDNTIKVIHQLVYAGHVFTVEPSPGVDGVWFVGVLPQGAEYLKELFGPLMEVGTLADHLNDERA